MLGVNQFPNEGTPPWKLGRLYKETPGSAFPRAPWPCRPQSRRNSDKPAASRNCWRRIEGYINRILKCFEYIEYRKLTKQS